jgi:spore maturation protein CgeB
MKIILVTNKTYRGVPDGTYWYVYQPLLRLGHQVYLYDTVEPDEKDFNKVIEILKPDLIYCVLTGDTTIGQYEPWDQILKETLSGRTKTFNWFCDDTWRFDTFSKLACHYFTVCSTPERAYIEKYKEEGYDNIIVGNWHANSEFFQPKPMSDREHFISFIGAPNPSRTDFLEHSGIFIETLYGLNQMEMFAAYSNSQVGLSLSVNNNDPKKGTQMKQRLFEVTAGGGVLLTQYHPGIEEYYEIDEEMMTFESPEELREKTLSLAKDPKMLENIASAGHKRFLKEHDSKIRIEKILKEIMAK